MPKIGPAFALYVKMLLACGVVFQMPVLVFALARMGMVTGRLPAGATSSTPSLIIVDTRRGPQPGRRHRLADDPGRPDDGALHHQHRRSRGSSRSGSESQPSRLILRRSHGRPTGTADAHGTPPAHASLIEDSCGSGAGSDRARSGGRPTDHHRQPRRSPGSSRRSSPRTIARPQIAILRVLEATGDERALPVARGCGGRGWRPRGCGHRRAAASC